MEGFVVFSPNIIYRRICGTQPVVNTLENLRSNEKAGRIEQKKYPAKHFIQTGAYIQAKDVSKTMQITVRCNGPMLTAREEQHINR